MFHRNCQGNEFINKPCQVDFAFLFRNNYDLFAFFGIFFSKLNDKLVLSANGEFHVVQTSVARNINNTLQLKVHIKHHRRTFHREVYLHFALLDFVSVNVHKKLILQKVLVFMYSRGEVL